MTDLSSDFSSALADRYAIEGELGRGGMATVYLASEPRHDRQVAIKVLLPELSASLGTERFLREIRIAGRLAHPHILPLIDSGEAAGMLYYVTPYVADGSLRARLTSSGRLEIGEAVRIAADIGNALDFAHRQGFMHRDVKPENILFADGYAVLADFGIARACDAVDASGLTEGGLTLGTPEYMSPEQAAGERSLGSATDIYSLACVVYEMLAGQPPLQGVGPRATMAKQVTATPQPVRAHRPEVSSAFESALLKALSKNPGDRFATTSEFVSELQRGMVAPPSALASSAERAIAVLPFVNSSSEADNEYLSDGLTDELINALVKVEGLRVASRTSVFALKSKPLDVRAIGALLNAAWVLEGTVRRSGNRLRITAQLSSTEDGRLLWSQRYDRTLEDVFAIQDELARTIVDTLRATSFASFEQPAAKRYTQSVAAYGLYLKGRYAWNRRTQEGVADAIRLFEAAIAEDPEYAPAYAGLSDSYAMQLDYRSVRVDEGHRLAKLYARKAIELDDTVAEAHSSLAWTTFIYDWDWVTSQREFLRAVELNPAYATAHQFYAFWLAAQGRLDEALVEAHTALELDPASVSIRRTVGAAYLYARRFDQVRHHLGRAMAMNPTAEETYRVLGLSLALQGHAEEAVRVLREGVALPSASTYTAATLGYALTRHGQIDEAAAILRHLAATADHSYVSPVAFATLHIGLGNIDLALAHAEQSHSERRGWPVYFLVNPLVDPLRDEPRFKAIIRAMGFPSG
ncbi:MAG: protein kinase domain-containing protein [Gemmatimonadaceae bacterium]